MTEDEAKTKWCPFAREFSSADIGAVAVNREGARLSFCIASACIAWREEPPPPRWEKTETGAVWQRALGTETPAVHGYCGLAGRSVPSLF